MILVGVLHFAASNSRISLFVMINHLEETHIVAAREVLYKLFGLIQSEFSAAAQRYF